MRTHFFAINYELLSGTLQLLRHLGHRLHLRRTADFRANLPLPSGGHQDLQPLPPRPAGQDILSDGVPAGQGLGRHQEDAGTPHAHQGLQADKVGIHDDFFSLLANINAK